ncbi:MAG: hypothetical protein P4M15_02090 [Alphaproteobacteria bacterium]|nr:hypothetical protein [Alphaproteobacteria bacterium]
MSFEIIGVIALVLGLASLIWFDGIKYDVFVMVTLLGSSAAINLSQLSISIQPAHLLLGLYAASLFSLKGGVSNVLKGVRFAKPGFWLLVTAIYGGVGAFLLPRIFAGSTYVNAIGATAWGFSLAPVPLGPSSGNLTQTIYFLGDLAAFLIAYAWSQTEQGRFGLARALLVYAIGNVVFAVADLATFWTGTGYLLDFIRNAAYVMHNETVVLGLKRIVGSFTEASSFAYASIGALAYVLSLWLDGVKPRLTLFLWISTMGLLIFSTSSTAYGALPVFLFCIYMVAIIRTFQTNVSSQTVAFVFFGPLLLTLAALLVVQTPSVLETIMNYADILILNKSTSSSALERGEWNASAMRNLFETYGFGAGIGSVRASSFPLAALSNLGLPGSLAYLTFLASMLLGRGGGAADPAIAPYCKAAKWSCFALLIAGTLSGALIDLGLPFFMAAGFVCAVTESNRERTSRSAHFPIARSPRPHLATPLFNPAKPRSATRNS